MLNVEIARWKAYEGETRRGKPRGQLEIFEADGNEKIGAKGVTS